MRRKTSGLSLLTALLLATAAPATAGYCGRHAVISTTLDDGNRLFGGGNFAALLMDGTVVGPRKK